MGEVGRGVSFSQGIGRIRVMVPSLEVGKSWRVILNHRLRPCVCVFLFVWVHIHTYVQRAA